MFKKIILVFLGLIIVFLIALIVYFSFYISKSREYLGNINISNIQVGNHNFQYKDHDIYLQNNKKEHNPFISVQVFRLAVAYKHYLEVPLIADSSLNQNNFRADLAQMLELENKIKKSLNASDKILSISFLASFADTSAKAKSFENNISGQTYRDYLKSLDQTSAEYSLAAKMFKDNINKYGDSNGKNMTMISSGSYTNSSILTKDADLMMSNAKKLSQIVKDNRVSFIWYLYHHNKAINYSNVNTMASLPNANLLNSSELAIANVDSKKIVGPYLVKTVCYDGINSSKYLYGTYSKTSNGTTFLPKDGSNNYFRKTTDAAGGSGWETIIEGNSYNCVDNEFQATLLNMDQYLDLYRDPLFDDNFIGQFSANDRKTIERISQEEKRFYQGKLFSDVNYEKLANNYLLAYNITMQASSEKGSSLSDVALKSLARYRFIKNKTSHLDYLYSELFTLDRLVDSLSKINANSDLYRQTVYQLRANYAITYFNFSELFWKIDGRPVYCKYNDVITDIAKKGFSDYKTLLKLGYSQADLLKIINIRRGES